MSASKTDDLMEILQDRQRFAELARFFIEKSSNVQATEAGDPRFGRYLKIGMDLLLQENLTFVFDQTESPIERVFINSLLLSFIKNDPLNLIIQHSVRNAPKQMEAFRERRRQFKEFSAWYKAKHGNLTGADDFLDREFARGKMEVGEHHYLRRHLVFYEYLGLEDRFHLIVQPGIPEVEIEGRGVRPDMLIWIPSNESVRIIVECDGFQHHSDKIVFIRDRKRDRALKVKGYEVLRYSGAEIYTDPVAASMDLADYLWSRGPSADA